MKNIITIITLFLFLVNIHGQQILNQNQTKDFYLQKSKDQNTAGWILLVSGTVMVISGSIAFNNSWDSSTNTATDAYGFIVLGGLIADIISIPFFISSGINKRKAASISFSYQNYSSTNKCDFLSNSMASTRLRIHF